MPEPHTIPSDTVGRACCTYCRTEFDARRPQGCPICAVTGRRRRQPTEARPKSASEEEAS